MNYYDIPCTNPWWNMAFDEWLLQNGPDEPVFRLWRNEPSVIIGHNQVAAQEVNLEYLQQHGIKLARRVTGGGAVYHDLQNLNYTFAGPLFGAEGASPFGSSPCGLTPPSVPDGPPEAKESGVPENLPIFGVSSRVARPSEGAPSAPPLGGSTSGAASAPLESSASGAPGGAALFASALRSLGVPAELSGRNDIFVEGRKISGYARSVWHNRELVHGTLMYNVDIDTLTAALNVEGSSKLNLKGVASVRSRVTNVRDYLPQFSSLDELQSVLQNLLAGTPVLAEGSRQKGPKMLVTPISDPGFPSKRAENAGNPHLGPGVPVKKGQKCWQPLEDWHDNSSGAPIRLIKSQLAEIDKLASEKFASNDWIYKQ